MAPRPTTSGCSSIERDAGRGYGPVAPVPVIGPSYVPTTELRDGTAATARAAEDSWPRVQAFLAEGLGGESND